MSACVDHARLTELRQQIDGLTSFNRHVAHDLRGPIHSMADALRLARQALGRGEFQRAARLIDTVAGSADGLAQLLSDLLALAEAADAPLAESQVDLTHLAHEAIEQVRRSTPAAASVFQLQQLPRVTGSSALLRQVFVNLIGNAAKFTHAVPHPQIEIGLLRTRMRQCAVFVRDNGVGFDAAQAGRLFEPFSRLHGAAYAGHGIGLSLVKRVVERHGGSVWATACARGGAAFHFTLAGL